MRPRLLGSIVLGALAVLTTGCPDDPGNGEIDTGRRDGGVCHFVDVGPSAPDGDEPEDSGADAFDAASDAGDDAGDAGDATDAEDAATDATDTADVGSETADATADSTTDAASADADATDTSFDTALSGFDAGAPVPRSAVDEIINLSCTFTSCHNRGVGAGGLVLLKPAVSDWYPNVVGVTSQENPSMPYVDPGNPSNSWLAHKIVGDQCMFTAQCKDRDCGDQMPAANEPLDDSDIKTILDWIRQGAKPK
jgi:nucleoid-associated protein YgaU